MTPNPLARRRASLALLLVLICLIPSPSVLADAGTPTITPLYAGATIADNAFLCGWTAVSGATGYGIELLGAPPQSSLPLPDPSRIGAAALSGTAWLCNSVGLAAGTYWYRALAWNAAGFLGNFSRADSFTVPKETLTIDSSDPSHPVFHWQGMPTATGYGVELLAAGAVPQHHNDTTADPNRIAVAVAAAPSLSWQGSTAGLQAGTYAARAIAWNARGFLGGFSEPAWLTAAAPPAPTVSVDASQTVAVLGPQPLGINVQVTGSHLLDPAVLSLLQQVGVNLMRIPGGSGSDIYHWQTNSATPGSGMRVPPQNTFDNLMTRLIKPAGAQAIVTVNYGSSAAGSGGGDPAEAAAWVDHANNAAGYGVTYWEVGNELYGNGYYGPTWNPDYHSCLSPDCYATNAQGFITAMKARDPSIQVGVGLSVPQMFGYPDWNDHVLQGVCSSIDFVAPHWYPERAGSESDPLLLSSTQQIPGVLSALRGQLQQHCGAHAAAVKILVTETGSVGGTPGNQTTSVVGTLFQADDIMQWLAGGANAVVWHTLFQGMANGNNVALHATTNYGDYGLLSSGDAWGGKAEPPVDTPMSSYWGLVMLHHTFGPGDSMVSAASTDPSVSAYAVRQTRGSLAVMLINKDPDQLHAAVVGISGFNAAGATLYSYGLGSSGVTAGGVTTSGNQLSLNLPPYSLSVVVFNSR